MAVVGTAFVRLRVIGDKLKQDIGKSIQGAVDSNTSPLEQAGETIGEKISESAGEAVNRSLGSQMGRISDEIGDAIGRRMAENMGRSLRSRLAKPFRDSFTRVRPVISRAGDELSKAFSSFTDGIRKKLGGKGGKGGLGGILMAAMGGLITVLPSILAGAGAVIGAYMATAVTAVAAFGPAAAGAAVTAVAAFTAIKISSKLIGLAMDTETAALTRFQERTQRLKDTIGRPVQAGLLAGLTPAVAQLQRIVPQLNGELTRTGAIVGNLAVGFVDAVTKGAGMDRIRTILVNSNNFTQLAGEGVSRLGQAFVIFVSRLGPVLDFMGQLISDVGTFVLNAALAGEASGQLDSWITRVFDSMRRMVGILVDFGIGIYNVFTAAQPAAANLTTSLESIGRRFREWTGDEGNQQRMVVFFEKMRTIVAQVNDILGDLVGGALRGLENTNVASLSAGLETLRSLGAPIAQIFRAIQQAAGPQLQVAFQAFADVVTELANSGVIGILASAFANLFQAIAMVLSIPGVGTILSFVAGLAVLLKTVGLLVGVFRLLLPAFRLVMLVGRLLVIVIQILAAAFSWPIVIIAALVAALVWFFTQTEIGKKIITAVWEAIKAAIGAAVEWIIGAWDWMVAAFQSAVAWVVTLAQSIWSAISTAFNAVVDTVVSVFTTVRDFIVEVFTTVRDFIISAWNAIWGFVQPILQAIGDFFTTVFNGIRSVVETVINIIYEIWIRIWPLLALPIRVFYGLVLLLWEQIVAGITIAMNWISNIITTVWNAVFAFISEVLTAIWGFITMVWDGIVFGVTWALDRLWTGIQNIWNAIWGFIQPILSAIGEYIAGVWNGAVDAVSGALSAIWGFITSVWNAVIGFIGGVLSGIGNAVRNGWNAITEAIRGALNAAWGHIQDVWNRITGFVQGALDRLRGIAEGAWSALGNLGSGVLSGLKTAVNVVIDAVNTVINGINWAINAANNLPGADIPTIPKIPRLAKGGVVSPRGGGTLAMIAEAGRPERVEPLDPQGLSKRDRALIELLAGGAGGAPNVHVYLGTRELIELVDVVVEEKQDGLADRVLTGTKG